MRRSGDGFVRCSDGHVRWGRFGAAGVVFVVSAGTVDGATEPSVMLQLRSGFAHEGGTWSCAGGALDEGETPYDGALREASEEVGAVNGAGVGEPRLLGQYVFAPADDWSYTTVVVVVDAPFGESLNFETDAVEWVPISAVEQRPLHGGFAAAWPHLRAIIHAAPLG
jgi:8-oxo-dGTP diphosphatase